MHAYLVLGYKSSERQGYESFTFIEILILSLKQTVQTPCVAPPNWQQHLLVMIKGTGKLFTKSQSSFVKPTLGINKKRDSGSQAS